MYASSLTNIAQSSFALSSHIQKDKHHSPLRKQKKKSYSVDASLPLVPIILGESHKCANSALALLYNVKPLQDNDVTVLAREYNKTTEECVAYLDKRKGLLPHLREDVRQIADNPFLAEDKCEKALLWFTDCEVKNFFKNHGLYDGDDKPPFEDILEYHPKVTRFGKEIENLTYQLLPAISHDKDKVIELYYKRNLMNITPLDLVASLFHEKGFEYHSIDMGRQYAVDMTGDKTAYQSNEVLVLRDQGMMEEIQELQRKHSKNVIAVMGLFHAIALKEHYPNSAIYRDVTGSEKVSFHDIRYNKTKFNNRYSEDIDFKNCLKNAFKPASCGTPLVEPSDEVLKILYRLTKPQESDKDKAHDRQL